MEYLDYGHNAWLVATSFLVALVAGATGLSLTKDLSQKDVTRRKVSIALASVALGGGIWSMHFVAMLGLQLPILFYYDSAITLVSALFAIFVVAIAFVLLHFRPRTKATVVSAGVIVGCGILIMHYIGMAGMNLCRPVYTVQGVLSSSVAAILLCILAFHIAYNARNNRNIALGALCFGVAVFLVHFLAMFSTGFVASDQVIELGPRMSNEVLALGVILTSFVIFASFLWVGSTYLIPQTPAQRAAEPAFAPTPAKPAATPSAGVRPKPMPSGTIPCERSGAKIALSLDDVLFIRADAHYTQVYTLTDHYFCSWPITEATKRLVPQGFLKVHRSYLVNPGKVVRFERNKDKGSCSFAAKGVQPVPVSRSHLKDARLVLG